MPGSVFFIKLCVAVFSIGVSFQEIIFGNENRNETPELYLNGIIHYYVSKRMYRRSA
jgi:hypothetical protein